MKKWEKPELNLLEAIETKTAEVPEDTKPQETTEEKEPCTEGTM